MTPRYDNPRAFGIGETPLLHVPDLFNAKLYLKLESANPFGSIKDRTAFFILRDLQQTGQLDDGARIVESTSGNLGIAFCHLLKDSGVIFTCLIDETISKEKRAALHALGADTTLVALGESVDYREARMRRAAAIQSETGAVWTNQYDNDSNVFVHRDMTAEEIWRQTKGQVGVVVAPVGTGGTVCGLAAGLKAYSPDIIVVGVEPHGSTVFGGEHGNYLSIGWGLAGQSGIIRRWGGAIDYFAKVDDAETLTVARWATESLEPSIGLTGCGVIAAATAAITHFPDRNVVAVIPDNAEKYHSVLAEAVFDREVIPIEFREASEWKRKYDIAATL